MSELQIDDPDPLPDRFQYPVSMTTDLAYEGHDLSADLAEQERIGLERESISRLSNYASRVLESSYGIGGPTERRAIFGKTELYRKVLDGDWVFSIVDTEQGKRRCRAWTLGGVSISWCEDEWRYEPGDDVLRRLAGTFPLIDETQQEIPAKSRTKRALALIGLRG